MLSGAKGQLSCILVVKEPTSIVTDKTRKEKRIQPARYSDAIV